MRSGEYNLVKRDAELGSLRFAVRFAAAFRAGGRDRPFNSRRSERTGWLPRKKSSKGSTSVIGPLDTERPSADIS